MVSHRSAPGSPSRNLRFYGFAAAYAFVVVTGTAIMMAAFAPDRGGSETGSDGQRVTAVELPNDKRGF